MSLYRQCIIPPWLFQKCLSLVFRSLIVLCLSVNFFRFILLRICSASRICSFVFVNFGMFLAVIFFAYSVNPSPFLLLGLHWWMLAFCYCSTSPEALSVYFLPVHIVYILLVCLQVHWVCPVIPLLVWRPSGAIFIFIVAFFSSTHFHWSLLRIFISCWDCLFFLLFNRICNWLLKHFYDNCFKILVR